MDSRSYRTLLTVVGMLFASACSMIVAPDWSESEEVAIASNVDSVKRLNAGGSANEAVIGVAGMSGSIVLPETDTLNTGIASVTPQDQATDVLQKEVTIGVDVSIDHESLISEIIALKMQNSDTTLNFNAVEFNVMNRPTSVPVRISEAVVCQNPNTIASVKLARIFILNKGVALLESTSLVDQGCWKLIQTKVDRIIPVGGVLTMQILGVLDSASVDQTNTMYYMGLYNDLGGFTVLSLSGITLASTLSSELLTVECLPSSEVS